MIIAERLAELQALGFDRSYALGRDDSGRFTKAIRIRCSQCEALAINGHATHEQRCPNARRAYDRIETDDFGYEEED